MATVSPSAPYKQIDAHPEAIRFPLMEWPLIGFLLAFICGTLNAWTLMNAGTFATVQSGNVASSGIYLAAGDWTRFGFAWGSVLAFGLGSMLCGCFMTSLLKRGRISQSFDEHETLMAALRAGQAEGARRAMQAHFASGLEAASPVEAAAS